MITEQLILQYGALGAIIVGFLFILKWVLGYADQLIENNKQISMKFTEVITNHMAHVDSHIQEDVRIHEKTNEVLLYLLEEIKRSRTNRPSP